MKKSLMLVLVLLAYLVSAANAAPQRPVGPRPGGDITPPHKPIHNTVQKYVGREYRTGQEFPVRAELGLDRDFIGRRILSVTVFASSRFGRGEIELQVNNRAVDFERNISRVTERVILNPRYGEDVLGEDIRTLQLRFVGNIWVERVMVEFAQSGFNPGGERPDLKEFVGEYVYSNSSKTLPIRRILNIDGPQYNGRKVAWVMVTLRSNRARGFARLIVNNRPVGRLEQIRENGDQRIMFNLDSWNNVLGRDIRMLQVDLQNNDRRGDIYIKEVGIKFERAQY